MAKGLNKVLLIGNLGADPEIKYTPNGTAIANLNIATSENRKNSEGEWEEKTEWHRVVAFSKQAETCKDYLHKGSKIYLEGRLQTRSWDDANGQKHYMTEIVVSNFLMLDGKPSDTPVRQKDNSPAPKGNPKQASDSFPEEDEDLPF
jgi:single-strand DNA-binding protein